MNKELIVILVSISNLNEDTKELLCEVFSIDQCMTISCYSCPIWNIEDLAHHAYTPLVYKTYEAIKVAQYEQRTNSNTSRNARN